MGSCTKTKKEEQPWWIVDLEYDYQIAKVEITNMEGHHGK